MTSFTHRKLTSNKSLPELLKEERLKMNLSLEKISLKTQISLRYLVNLENGDYHLLPGEIYVSQFIRKIAKLLNFSEKNLLAIYQNEKDQQLNFFKSEPKPLPKKRFLIAFSPKLIRNSFIGLIIICLVSYLGLEIKNIFTPPFLQIIQPASQTITNNPTITIEGKTAPEAIVSINQQKILIKTNGSFSQEVDLNIGINLFEISAAKKHSKKNILTVSVLRQETVASEINIIDRTVSVK